MGTTVGTHDVVNTPEIQATSYQPTAPLPAGQLLYARMWAEVGGVWRSVDSTFTTASTATLTSPANGATGVSPVQTFQWTSVPNVQAYVLWLGTTVGTHDVVNTPEMQPTSYQPAAPLPAGQLLYARMWAEVGGVWRSVDSTFTTASTATLTSPANGATNVSPLQTLQWTSVPSVQAYVLWVGTTVGTHDVVNTPEMQPTSYQPAAPLPAGQLLYARMWAEVGGVWRSTDSTFTTAP